MWVIVPASHHTPVVPTSKVHGVDTQITLFLGSWHNQFPRLVLPQ